MGARFDLAFAEVKKTWDQLFGGNATIDTGDLASNVTKHEEL